MCLEIIFLLKSPWPVPIKCTDPKRIPTKVPDYCNVLKPTTVDLGSTRRKYIDIKLSSIE